MSKLWTEVWTRPGHATFGRVIDDPPVTSGGFSDGLNKIGAGNLALPSSYNRFSEILDETIASLIRVFSEDDPTAPVFEWLPQALQPSSSKDDPTVEVTGQGIKSVLSYARLEPWDWDGTDAFQPLVPDWQFGLSSNLLQNPGFEQVPMPNGGFESGSNASWAPTTGSGYITEANAVIAVFDPPNAFTGDWYGVVDPQGARSGALRSISGLVTGEIYIITGHLQAPAGDRFRAGVSDAANATHLNAYAEEGWWWAELDNAPAGTGSSDGTWQDFTIMFLAAAPTTQLAIIYDDAGAGPDFWIDTWNIEGEGVGVFPWTIREAGDAVVVDFNYEDTTVRTGTGALHFDVIDALFVAPGGNAAYGSAGVRQQVGTTPGVLYTGSVWIRQDSGSTHKYIFTWRRTTSSGPFGSLGSSVMRAKRVDVPSGVWTQVEMSAVADTSGIWFEVSFLGSDGNVDLGPLPSPESYIDDAVFYAGLPAATIGDIWQQIYADATSDHPPRVVWDNAATPGTPYLSLDFDDVLDSAGQAWLHPELTIRLTMRMSYSQIMGVFANTYGYEYRVVPDDVELGTWLLQIYNPGTMQTDRTALATPSIQGGSTDVGRSIRQYLPTATDFMVEGIGRITGRDRDATMITNLGRIESASLSRDAAGEDGVMDAAAEVIGVVPESYAYNLVDPQDQPISTYQLGDLIHIEDPPDVSTDLRFVSVDVSYTALREEWDTQFGLAVTTNADAAVAEAVAELTGRFIYPDELGGGGIAAGGEAGMITVGVAAADASGSSKDKADFLCTGSFDEQVIMAAMKICWDAGGGTVWLSEGHFNIEPDLVIVGYSIAYPAPITLRGMGYGTELNYVSFTNFAVYVAAECILRDLIVRTDTG